MLCFMIILIYFYVKHFELELCMNKLALPKKLHTVFTYVSTTDIELLELKSIHQININQTFLFIFFYKHEF